MKTLMAFMAIVGLAGYAVEPEQPLISYKATISKTETVWDVCSRIASNQDNMQELVWRTMKENHINNPGEVQPGQEIIVRVRAVKK